MAAEKLSVRRDLSKEFNSILFNELKTKISNSQYNDYVNSLPLDIKIFEFQDESQNSLLHLLAFKLITANNEAERFNASISIQKTINQIYLSLQGNDQDENKNPFDDILNKTNQKGYTLFSILHQDKDQYSGTIIPIIEELLGYIATGELQINGLNDLENGTIHRDYSQLAETVFRKKKTEAEQIIDFNISEDEDDTDDDIDSAEDNDVEMAGEKDNSESSNDVAIEILSNISNQLSNNNHFPADFMNILNSYNDSPLADNLRRLDINDGDSPLSPINNPINNDNTNIRITTNGNNSAFGDESDLNI